MISSGGDEEARRALRQRLNVGGRFVAGMTALIEAML